MAGSVTVAVSNVVSDVRLITYTWTADVSDGSVPAQASPVINGDVILVVTNPGTPAPTDNYDVTLTDEDGVDVMGGALADRDQSNSEQAKPIINSEAVDRFVDGTLTLSISNNSVNSAQGVVKVWVRK